jgi:hypothetical protein
MVCAAFEGEIFDFVVDTSLSSREVGLLRPSTAVTELTVTPLYRSPYWVLFVGARIAEIQTSKNRITVLLLLIAT